MDADESVTRSEGMARPSYEHTRGDPDEQQLRARVRGALFGDAIAPVKVGRYSVLERIGAGGLGVVYSAYDPQLDRRVALKLVRADRISADAAARMQREAQAMAQIAHPHVVTVHDTGVHDGAVFIAMELVDGSGLREWAAQRRDWRAIRDVLVQAGQGLAAAHRQGLVHRDFKPANVLVGRDDRARVLDFGLARAGEAWTPVVGVSSESLVDADVTTTGVLLGTPAYMAPEQFAGRADARSDQWSFCVAAYEVLYGVRPFDATTREELIKAHTRGASPEPPLGSQVPRWLHRALLRGLSHDAVGRFANMDELLVALQRDKHVRRMQWGALAVAIMFSSGVTAAATVWIRATPTAESREAIEQLEAQARDAADRGYFLYPPPGVLSPTAFSSIVALEQFTGPGVDEARARAVALRRELAEAAVVLGESYADRQGGATFAADFYAAALVLEPEHPVARARSTMTAAELSWLRDKAGRVDFTEAERAGAEPAAVLADRDWVRRSERLASLLRSEAVQAASTRESLARVLAAESDAQKQPSVGRSGRPATPASASSRSAPVAVVAAPTSANNDVTETPAPTRGIEPKINARAEVERGRAAQASGDDVMAEQAYHRALEKDHDNAAALLGLAEIHFERGAYQKAVRFGERAVRAAPRGAAARMQLGDACFRVHRYDDARSEYQAAAALGHPAAAKALERVTAAIGD